MALTPNQLAQAMKLESKDTQTLRTQSAKLENDLCELMFQTVKDQTKIDNTTAMTEAYALVLKKRETADAERTVSIKAEPTATPAGNSADLRALDICFKDNIPTFGPGMDISIFITKLDNCFKAYVTEQNNLEGIFCRFISSKLNVQYQTSFLNLDENKRSTWTQIKEYLKNAYAPKETIFQTLSHLWDLQREASESIHQYGIRMEEKGAEVLNRVEAVWKEKHKTSTPVPDLTITDYTNIISSMLVVQHLRQKEPEVFRSMINDMDSCFKPTELTLKAQTYVDRFGQNDPANIQTGIHHGNGIKKQSPKDRSKQDCFVWKKHGNCRRRKCPFKHDKRFKKEDKPKEDKANPSNQNLADGDTCNFTYQDVGHEVFHQGL